MLTLPPQLDPFLVNGQVAFKVMLDLTVYLTGPTVEEFETLCDLYERFCPPAQRSAFKIDEIITWSNVAAPDLTESGRRAARAGIKRPYFEATRNRIRDGRAFAASLWDRRMIDDPKGSWSFTCRAVKQRSTGVHAFARFLLPLQSSLDMLLELTRATADEVPFFSGHGGLSFVYEPWFKSAALNEIYARAKRFWGIDVEDLNATILLIRKHIKTNSWITLVGNQFAGALEGNLAALAKDPEVAIHRARHGFILVAGPQPVAGDRNLKDPGLKPYFAIAQALAPLFPTDHPDFAGIRFKNAGDTTGWARRFVDPAGW